MAAGLSGPPRATRPRIASWSRSATTSQNDPRHRSSAVRPSTRSASALANTYRSSSSTTVTPTPLASTTAASPAGPSSSRRSTRHGDIRRAYPRGLRLRAGFDPADDELAQLVGTQRVAGRHDAAGPDGAEELG